MHRVATASQNAAVNRILDVFHADRAILLEPLIHALMVIFHRNVIAAVAVLTVESGIFATYSANSALITMEDAFLLGIIVVKRANWAVILRKILFTLDTGGRLGLLSAAAETLNMRDVVAVERVMPFGINAGIPLIVVAEPAGVVSAFAGRMEALFFAASIVVFAPEDLLFFFKRLEIT